MSDSLRNRVSSLYRRYDKAVEKDTVDWFMDAIADLTSDEIDSAFRNGPKVWSFMPRPKEFRDAVQVTKAPPDCEKCVNGFVADREHGPNAVKRCECRKKSADAHGKGIS